MKPINIVRHLILLLRTATLRVELWLDDSIMHVGGLETAQRLVPLLVSAILDCRNPERVSCPWLVASAGLCRASDTLHRSCLHTCAWHSQSMSNGRNNYAAQVHQGKRLGCSERRPILKVLVPRRGSMYNRHLFPHMEEVHISEVNRMSSLSSSFNLWSVAWRQGFDESLSALPYIHAR
jgi:hypothetical protein